MRPQLGRFLPPGQLAVDWTNPLTNALVALLPMHDLGFANLAGSERGTIVGNGPTSTPSPFGNSLSIPGSGYVSFTDSPAWALLGDMTLSMWINVADVGSTRTLVSHSTNNYPEPFDLNLNGGNGVITFSRGQQGGLWQYYSSGGFPSGGWAHLAISSLAPNTGCTMYVNAVPVSQGNPASYGSSMQSPAVPMLIGIRKDNNGQYSGQIGPIKFWKRVLRPDEIMADFQRPLGMIRELRPAGRRPWLFGALARRRPFIFHST